jgi:hypothetical protein
MSMGVGQAIQGFHNIRPLVHEFHRVIHRLSTVARSVDAASPLDVVIDR